MSSNPEHHDLLIQSEKELESLLEEEESYWKLRSREDWLKSGDKNTRWFHSKATSRKRKNEIKGIFYDKGTWVEKEEDIGKIASNFFKSLLNSSFPSKIVSTKISEEQKRKLDVPFTKEEVERVIKDMNPSKAPGPDGDHAMLYQNYWDILGEDTIRVCLGFLNHKDPLEPINKTYISLIPKTKDLKRMSEFRPISLCCMSYKIIAKVLANILKTVLAAIISPSQYAFIPGRQISDNVLVGFECIHALNRKKKGKVGHLAIKLDMSKAYNRVEWALLEEIMEKMNFSEGWIRKVMMCISSVTYSILINGVPQEEFKPSRGIRQGDPLSPYLFLLCAEGLSALFRREENLSNISGFQITKFCPPLTHLFFADDSIIFIKAESKEIDTLKRILKEYEQASGQTINLDKSSFMTSNNMKPEAKTMCERSLGIKRVENMGIYLGMSSQVGRNKGIAFKRIKDRVEKTLQGWKEKLFSLRGKEVLIKAVAQAIPTYTMSCIRIPNKICKEIERLCARFWWGTIGNKNINYWMSWAKMFKSKDQGGLGFKQISFFNQAMLAKQSWRIMRNPDSLLFKILRGKYFKDGNFLEAPIGNAPSMTWRSICWGRELFKKGYRWRVGNGNLITIDKDPWINRKGNPRPIPVMDHLKGIRVNQLLDENNKWRKEIIMGSFDPQDVEDILAIPLGGKSVKDEIIWNFDKKRSLLS